MKYLQWRRFSMVSDLVGMIVWMSLSTFMITVKDKIGVTNIPIFEVTIFIISLMGIQLAHIHIMSLKTALLVSIVIETVFLMGLYYVLLYYSDMALYGIVVYLVIIANSLFKPVVSEGERVYEDSKLKSYTAKKGLAILRKRHSLLSTIGGAIGTVIALICLTYFKVDIVEFAKVMLIGNILSNIYDWFIWNKYVRVL